MNKMLKGLLVALLAVSAAQVKAHTNKTFLMPRPHGVNLPMEYTTFDELVSRRDECKFGGNLQITGFYQDSTNGDDLAKYFLFKDKSTIKLTKDVGAPAFATSTAVDLDLGYIIHDGANNGPRSADIHLDPEQTAYGVRFDYHQDLDKILKGLYLRANLPVVHVKNEVNLRVSATGDFPAGTANAAAQPIKTTLENFFNGTFENTTVAANAQSKLTHAKMTGDHSETGVADIDIALGYKFLNKECYHAALAIAFTIPTGNEADGVYVFEPIVGNGKHWGLGGDFCAGARVWGDMCHNLKVHLKIKYRYLFESSEKRTLGIKGRNWGQYHLLVPANVANNAATSLIPAANITTKNVDVTPGSQFDGILGLAYNNGGLSLDLGYNLYFREREDVHLKDTIVDGQFAIAARNLSVAIGGHNGLLNVATFTPANVTDGVDGGAAAGALSIITKDTLDTAVAETPSQTTHSIYGNLGYIFREWDYPLMLKLGGKYEFASKNSALEQWGIWGGVGIGF